MNAITITGNLAVAPESRALGEGRSLTNLRIANNELVNGEQVLNGYFDVTVFGPMAARALKLKTGDRIVVTGRLQHSTFEREDGTRGGRTRLIANEIGRSMLFDDVVVVPPATETAAPAQTTEGAPDVPPL